MNNKKFQDSLKKLRSDRGLSQSEVADAIGVTQAHVSDMERGRRVPNKPIMLALAYRFKEARDWV